MPKDHVLRPGSCTDSKKASHNAIWAIFWIWLIFTLAFAASVYLRYAQTETAITNITALAGKISLEINKPDASVTDVVDNLTKQLYSETDSGVSVGDYKALVRVLTYHLDINGTRILDDTDSKKTFIDETRKTLLTHLFTVTVIHFAILAVFPGFFTIVIRNARRHIVKYSRDPANSNASSTSQEDTFWNAVWWRRHHKFLEDEAKMHVGRRLGFALLASLSVLYILAPAGLLASAIGEYVSLNAIPGDESQPFWFDQFARVSPFVLGLAGFLLYSLITFGQRATANDLSNRAFLSFWNRGITVVILSLALTAIDEGSTIFKAGIFIAGMFPNVGLQAIGKIAQTGADKLASIEPKGLSHLNEIDSLKEGSLREMGITDTSDLALTDLERYLIVESRIHPRSLMEAVDRTLLLEQLGELAPKLKTIPIFTASEFVLFSLGSDAYKDRLSGDTGKLKCLAVEELGAQKKKDRLAKINEAMDVHDAQIHIADLKCNHNQMFILDNKLFYNDV